MSANRPTKPMPTTASILELKSFLAANTDVANADGEHAKAVRYQAMLDTVTGLEQRAANLDRVTRVVVVHNAPAEQFLIDSVRALTEGGRAYDKSRLYDDGCVIDVQDDGRTLKVFPTPPKGVFTG